MGRKSELPIAERREAVLSLLRQEETATSLGRRLGVSAQTVYRWRDLFLAAGDAGLRGDGGSGVDPRDRRIQELEREVSEREQIIGELTFANRLLKKLSDGSR
jgi:transposase-like protein